MTTIGGAAGFYALSANIATLNLTSNTTAQLQTDAAIGANVSGVTIAANQTSNVDVQGQGYQGGVAAAGAVVTTANVNANVNASVADGASVGTSAAEVGGLSVLTTNE